jgi:hypothetical protein
MNMRRLLPLLVIAVLTSVPSFLLTGCENDDSPDTKGLDSYFDEHPYVSDPRGRTGPRIVTISPASAEITFVGEQIVFEAAGGRKNYVWDTADHSQGTVSVRPGTEAAVYTASVVGPNDVIVYDQDGHADVATINGPSSPLVATANPTEIDIDGGVAVVTAGGGIPPYIWTVGDVVLGNVSPTDGSSTVYTRGNPGDNTVTVHDSSGNSFTVLISQP